MNGGCMIMVYDNGVQNLILVELVEYKHDPKIYNKILKLLKEQRTKNKDIRR